jgi:hypothetical protein
MKRPPGIPDGLSVVVESSVGSLAADALTTGSRLVDATAVHPRSRRTRGRSHGHVHVVMVVVVMVVVVGESYRARRNCKDGREGDCTNLHVFLLINAGSGICFIER